ncbi:MAG: thioesterase family protein [Desulfocapsaceae bacterium]|nr:thioesterase family protein [Desulfocapsaceae bacterium]
MKPNEMRLELLRTFYEKSLPFNRLLGISIDPITSEEVQVRIDMREELVGNYIRGILHGGVISALLDLTGGLIASVGILSNGDETSVEELTQRLSRIGTIDLRIDYLRAGKGKSFLATGHILRQGNRVSVIRTELHNNESTLIAVGIGSYQIS